MARRGKFGQSLGIAAVLAAAASCAGGTPPANDPPRPGAAPGEPMPIATDPGALGATPRAQLSLAVPEAPLGLTASDGTGLRLASMQARAVVEGPLAFTELHLSFENPEPRVLEGTFRIALPQGASISRFAMLIGSEWQEGEVVEKQAARIAYEDFLHRKQDPALMEKSAGNEFSARVFPIPARGVKDIIVSYVHEIPEGTYALPLRGLPELGRLEASVHVAGAPKQPPSMNLVNAKPSADVVVDARMYVPTAFASGPLGGVRSGELAIVRVRPQADKHPESLAGALVLVDTSASRALGFEDEVRAVERLVKKIGEEGGAVTVAAFDQTVAPVFEGPAAKFGAADVERLRARGALGASNLERALGWARDHAKKAGDKRVIVVTDGVATAGASEPAKLGAAAASLKEAGVVRLDALAVGGIRDDAALTRMVRGNLPHDGVVAEASDPARALARLGEATRSGVKVAVEGATWAFPSRLDGVQAGDAFTVYAEVPAGKPVRVSVDGAAPSEAPLRATERPLAERAVAQAKVASLLEREGAPGAPKDLARTVTMLGVKHRIVTPYTSMLVLETDADYARFGIDRRAPADVLAVQGTSVGRLPRALPTKRPVPREEELALAAASLEDRPATPRAPSRPGRPSPRPAAAAGAIVAPQAAAPAEQGKGSDKEKDDAPRAKPVMAEPALKSAATTAAPSPAAPPPPPPPPPPNTHARPRNEEVAAAPRGAAAPPRAPRGMPVRGDVAVDEGESYGVEGLDDTRAKKLPYEGRFAVVMQALADGKSEAAMTEARAWRAEQPGDVLALVALGEAAEARAQLELASRAYGSVIDLFPNRADLRRMAGERLDRLAAKDAGALELAVDTYAKAVADRPDHPASHRLYAYALLRNKQHAKAFDAIVAGLRRGYEDGRFEGADRILAEDVGLIGAAWAAAEPSRREEIQGRVRAAGGTVESGPSVRFVLVWETDANDVDFHIHDARGGHAYFSQRELPSGGSLYADVTTGYGPECFTIRSPKARRAAPYRLEAHYYSRGPMGYGMGKLQVVEHDGKGGLTFEDRPFVVMLDQAYVDLGTVK